MEEWDSLLRELSDDPSEYEREAGTVLLTRQGQEHILTLREIPGEGLSVALGTEGQFVPISTYVQRELLGLPRLAKQVARTLERAWSKRPGRFVEGPASFDGPRDRHAWPAASQGLRAYLNESEPGTTRLVQLMAAAGQGKTALLEHAALELARDYQPIPFPAPILLTIDLLGRYVGTVDDAIAGALNNTYLFPSLTQRDVSLCIRRRWLILALDGFDELVARVGVREAFLRITELLEQLHSSGTIVVSARESFFELYQISAAIRSYLQPKVGTYSTAVVKLLDWGEEQGVEVFRATGSQRPAEDLSDLLATFGSDKDVVFHPFFLTRLADLWMKGERFGSAEDQRDHLARTKYVIETYIQRESGEKWVDREGRVFLSPDGHNVMLGGVAIEMWRSGAFWLGVDELRIAAEIALADLELPASQVESVLDRLPTHAALQAKGRGFGFLHDRFLHFFLGLRLAQLLQGNKWADVRDLFAARELSPSAVEWIDWNWRRLTGATEDLLKALTEMRDGAAETTIVRNIAQVSGRVLDRFVPLNHLEIRQQTFDGDMLRGRQYQRIRFAECEFWHLDLTGTELLRCDFTSCKFGDIHVDAATSMEGSTFDETTSIVSVDSVDGATAFAPDQIVGRLIGMGAMVTAPPEPTPPVKPRVRSDVTLCVEKYVKASERTCDVAVEDLEEDFGKVAIVVATLGLECGVLREITKGVRGPKKRFVRFRVDRERLLRGQVGSIGDTEIDTFWAALEKKYPA